MTNEQIETAARALCAALGVNDDAVVNFPDDPLMPHRLPTVGPRWELAAREIQRFALISAVAAAA